MQRKTTQSGLTKIYEDLRKLYTDPPNSAAAKYPDVSPPDDPLSPVILAARWASGDLHGEDMPRVAADLLEVDYDTPTLRRLSAEMRVENSADIDHLVSRMFCELGVSYPLHEGEAEFIASRQIAREVIAGLRNRWAASSHIEIVIYNRIPAKGYLDEICSINDEIKWELPHRRSLQALSEALMDVFAELASMRFEGIDESTAIRSENSSG